ncbi:unnamed protein product [Dicrocoelium dendriticum]|nr:unnamed protein product [Dicrocoelium dendriticum]
MPSRLSGAYKKRSKCGPNLLFEQWLTEAMNDAFARQAKSHHTYRKALLSLQKYPLLLSSGKECRILEGFGQKICDFLDEKLSIYAEELGVSPSEAILLGNKKRRLSSEYCLQKSQSSVASRDVPGTATMQSLPRVDSTWAKNGDSSAEQLLLTLFKTSKHPMGCSLQELAACLRNPNSTLHADSVTTHLQHLVDRGVVGPVPSRPGYYRLLDNQPASPLHIPAVDCFRFPEGCQLGTGNGEVAGVTSHPAPAAPVDSEPVEKEDCTGHVEVSSTCISYPLTFTYANLQGEPVRHRFDAHVSTFDSDAGDGEQLTGFRILCAYEDLIVAGLPYRMDWSTSSSLDNGSSVSAYLLDPAAPLQCTRIINSPTSLPQTNVSVTPNLSIHISNIVIQKPPDCLPESIPGHPVSEASSFNLTNVTLTSSCASVTVQPLSDHIASRSQPVVSLRQNVPSSGVPSGIRAPSLVVAGGSYKIVLLADVREQFGLNRVKQLLPPVLQSLGVDCESRALPVGDFLWVVRWVDERGEISEAVLDYIVERKRMDDLASSIVDGRFQEQKYRMKRTQISHPIYLIEECSYMRNQRIPFETLLQAISNGQIIDGFQVMVTRGSEDSVDWLASMTSVLQERSAVHHLIYSPQH